ncbi:MAG TPA: hypothetical protein ENI15_05195 [Spirochaetes bacterium]|nr:hypothetical protein [Spirochaetota bacterium]
MSVRIKEILVKNLGPIVKPVSFKLGLINLLYGRNETGKTLLVEFLIRSLFRNKKPWMLRPIKGSGKVVVEGITDKPVEFNPASKYKLEDHFDNKIPGLPPDFSKLLVVKGAELEFGSVEGGIDQQIIKQYLSSKGVFEKIEKNIPAIIKKTRFEGREILGPNQGDIKIRSELGSKIEHLNELVNRINEEYSGGYRTELEKRRVELQTQKDDLTAAKQHLAFRLSKEIEELKMHLNRIDITALSEAGNNILSFETKLKDLVNKKEDQKNARLKSIHYHWLKIAKNNYEKLTRKAVRAPITFLLILTFLSIIASIVSMMFKLNTVSIIAVFLTLILFAVYSIFKIRTTAGSHARLEKESLEKEFKNRFNRDLESSTQIEEILLHLDEQHKKSEFLKEQIEKEGSALEELNIKISNFFKESDGKVIDHDNRQAVPGKWMEKIASEKTRIKKLTDLSKEKEIELAPLDVDKTDYKEEGNDKAYSKEKFKDVKLKLQEIENSLTDHDNKLESLKQSICHITSSETFENWEDILTAFYKERDETISGYKKITAGIIGQFIVHEVLEELRSEEDIKIIDSFKSKTIQGPLFALTGRYKEITFEDERLIVKDDYNDFLFKDLSTGAAEQILLALRIGFSSRLLAKDRLFLILDDSFQYSDWKRRPLSVEMMGELAKNGWQIICFTMDDHIKDLFKKTGKQFGNEFKFFELE